MEIEVEKECLIINGRHIDSIFELQNMIKSGELDTKTISPEKIVSAYNDGTIKELLSNMQEEVNASSDEVNDDMLAQSQKPRSDTERGVLCIDGRYVESLEELKNIISTGQFDIGTIKTNELLAAFRDGAVQEWLSTGTEEEISLAIDFSHHSMRHDKINDTDLLSLIVKLFGDLKIQRPTHKLNVSLQLQSIVFISPSGQQQKVTGDPIFCPKSGKVRFILQLKSNRAVNGSVTISLNCSQQSVELSKSMPLNTADKDCIPVEFELNYNSKLKYPIEFKYNNIVLYKCSLTSEILENGHEAVDLGLSVKWAKTNLGGTNEYDTGSLFSFAETKAKEFFTKYDYSTNVSNTSSADAATSLWGGKWRMPTEKEFLELINNCTWTWKSKDCGYIVEGKNHNRIFLRAAGMKDGYSLIGENECGQYWVKPQNGKMDHAKRLLFCSDMHIAKRVSSKDEKYCGLSIRPVLP